MPTPAPPTLPPTPAPTPDQGAPCVDFNICTQCTNTTLHPQRQCIYCNDACQDNTVPCAQTHIETPNGCPLPTQPPTPAPPDTTADTSAMPSTTSVQVPGGTPASLTPVCSMRTECSVCTNAAANSTADLTCLWCQGGNKCTHDAALCSAGSIATNVCDNDSNSCFFLVLFFEYLTLIRPSRHIESTQQYSK